MTDATMQQSVCYHDRCNNATIHLLSWQMQQLPKRLVRGFWLMNNSSRIVSSEMYEYAYRPLFTSTYTSSRFAHKHWVKNFWYKGAGLGCASLQHFSRTLKILTSNYQTRKPPQASYLCKIFCSNTKRVLLSQICRDVRLFTHVKQHYLKTIFSSVSLFNSGLN
jgi:hypothetical protein